MTKAPWVAACAAVAGIAAAAGVLHAREVRAPIPPSTERFMYLQSGAAARRAFLAWDAVAADVYWIRAIQHYGRDRRSIRQTGRFELLQPLLDVTTTLDPYFNIAYRFGAVFLSMDPPEGPGRSDQALALLEKGLANNPARWQYAHDIGFIYYWHAGDYLQAANWFDRAASMPGAPPWIRPLAALTRAQGGDRAGARRLLTELLAIDERYIKQAAQRGLAQIQALDALDDLQVIIERYRAATGAYPSGWADVIRAGLLPGLPGDASRTPFVYDAATHTVKLSPRSPLAPLPEELAASK